jgi:hypothetical protein
VAKNSIQGYWSVFGGGWALLRSTYFLGSLILTLVYPDLWHNLENGKPVWASLAIDILPSLLGFALGGMAIMLSFSSGRFLEAVRQGGKEDSFFMKMMASFFHFSIVLTTALIIAMISETFHHIALSFVGVWLTYYGITLVVATAGSIWHTARIFNAAIES